MYACFNVNTQLILLEAKCFNTQRRLFYHTPVQKVDKSPLTWDIEREKAKDDTTIRRDGWTWRNPESNREPSPLNRYIDV